MKAVTALLITASLTACFPNSAKHRTYAKIGEGAALASGIALLYVANSGADCDEMRVGDTSSSCRSKADMMSGVGLGLVLGGLVGFIVTVSTSPDDKRESPANTLPPTPIAPAAEDAPAKAAPATSTAEK